jgi:serine/threonine protein phosphatase 1
MNTRAAIIGDVHGQATQLKSMLMAVADRQIVLVGDYVNRGPDTGQTLDLLIELKSREPSTVFLLGNHEVLFLEFLDGRLPFVKFAALGGLPTIRSYVAHTHEDVRIDLSRKLPKEHYDFLLTCTTHFETAELVVSHCGINPRDPESRSRRDMVTATHPDLFAGDFRPSKLVICGHYSQASRKPYVADNLICIDTGCGTAGAPLTALLLPERIFLQR